MLGPSLFLYLFLHLSPIFLGLVRALPAASRRNNSLVVRQNDGSLTQPVTVQTQNILQTCVLLPEMCHFANPSAICVRRASGPMLQSCTLTFTPVTGPNGESLVQEATSCTLSVANNNGNAPPAQPPGTTASSGSTATDSAVATSSASAVSTASAGASTDSGASSAPTSAASSAASV